MKNIDFKNIKLIDLFQSKKITLNIFTTYLSNYLELDENLLNNKTVIKEIYTIINTICTNKKISEIKKENFIKISYINSCFYEKIEMLVVDSALVIKYEKKEKNNLISKNIKYVYISNKELTSKSEEIVLKKYPFLFKNCKVMLNNIESKINKYGIYLEKEENIKYLDELTKTLIKEQTFKKRYERIPIIEMKKCVKTPNKATYKTYYYLDLAFCSLSVPLTLTPSVSKIYDSEIISKIELNEKKITDNIKNNLDSNDQDETLLKYYKNKYRISSKLYNTLFKSDKILKKKN